MYGCQQDDQTKTWAKNWKLKMKQIEKFKYLRSVITDDG